MGVCSRRRVLAFTALAGTGASGGCTNLFVGQPRPKLIEMDQQLSGEQTVEITVTVENRGATGDIAVTIRALDDEDEPVKSVEETHSIAKSESVDLTIPIEAPTETARFAALVEPA